MQQYMKVKNKHPDCIILFRMGDFYETFYEDAKLIAKELSITLTKRGTGETEAPLAGIPYHAISPYLAKLVKKGYKVGIVEQAEDPKYAKGLVKRELVRIITPGTVMEPLILSEKSNNYLLSLVKDKGNIAIAFCDVSTGEFQGAALEYADALSEIRRLKPAELIIPSSLVDSSIAQALKDYVTIHPFEDRFFFHDMAQEALQNQFEVVTLKGFGIEEQSVECAAGALVSYLHETQMQALPHLKAIHPYRVGERMAIGATTAKNLELIATLSGENEHATLLGVLDKTTTPMGSRLLRKWLLNPLNRKEAIEERLEAVEELKDGMLKRNDVRTSLEGIYDVERLIGRVAFGNASPKDLIGLKNSLEAIPSITLLLKDAKAALLRKLAQVPALSEPAAIIGSAIKDDPNTTVREGNIIRQGYHAELDELHTVAAKGKSFLAELEEKERAATGIRSLKVKYNKVFGYFIEITRPNLHLVPTQYIRKQTQVNAERFVTEELKEKEAKILGAQERSIELEYELFLGVLEKLNAHIAAIQSAASNIAQIDCIASLALVAQSNAYTMPKLNEEGGLTIMDGRHPVIESCTDSAFIPNSCSLSKDRRMMLITGPNMAGKSTYMRQVALICLLAQMGSFVPAKAADICIHDAIFTRVGAHDDLVSGQSTFMVEMAEAADILHNATQKSLIIIDEIGRGTSTFDGVSLAWAIAGYISKNIRAHTLFATHYHQLNKLAARDEGIANYNIAVAENDESIIFLRKIREGGTDKSYGIEVAKLAGIPKEVIDESRVLMAKFEMEDEIGERIHAGLSATVREKKSAADAAPASKRGKKQGSSATSLMGFL